MKKLKNWLAGNSANVTKMGVLWNFIASTEYSLQSAVLVLAVTRINGLYDTGVFTLAYTITQMMTTIGNYGMRAFQVSDSQNEYSFPQYFSSRMVTSLVMMGICTVCACIYGLTESRGKLIMILCGYRIIEVIEDVIHGEMQKAGRLDVGAKIEAVRIFIVTAAFVGVCLGTRDVVAASTAMFACSLVVTLALNILVLNNFNEVTFRPELTRLYRLLWVCLPICACDFLYNNLVNAPKYAIERNLSEESQAVFSILFMPVFTISILSSFIYKPLMADMGVYWNQKENVKFFRIILKQFLAIAVLTLFIAAGGAIIGLRLLGIIYGLDLNEYKGLFVLLLGFGGVAALDAFLVIVLTIMRKQRWSIVAYAISMACVISTIDRMVSAFGLWGAGLLYSFSMGVVMVVLFPVVLSALYKARKNVECN